MSKAPAPPKGKAPAQPPAKQPAPVPFPWWGHFEF